MAQVKTENKTKSWAELVLTCAAAGGSVGRMKFARQLAAFFCGLITMPVIALLVGGWYVLMALWNWDSDWTKTWAYRLSEEWAEQLRRVRG